MSFLPFFTVEIHNAPTVTVSLYQSPTGIYLKTCPPSKWLNQWLWNLLTKMNPTHIRYIISQIPIGIWRFELDRLFEQSVCVQCISAQVNAYFNQKLVLWLLDLNCRDTENRSWHFFKLETILLPKYMYMT